MSQSAPRLHFKVIAEEHQLTIKCPKCRLTSFVSGLLDSSITKLVLKDESNNILSSYTALHCTANTFLQKVNKSITDFNESQLLELFFIASDKEKLVNSITVC